VKQIHELTATEIVEAIRVGHLTAVEVARVLVDRIARLEPALKAWAVFRPEQVLAEADRVDRAIAQGSHRGTLLGVPVGVKDIFNTQDYPTQMGSAIWRDYQPGNDARVVFNLRYEGGVVFGKTQTSEFAVHEPTETRNPRNFEHSPGTSSSGSAAAVACGMVPVALGSQTGGSTIRPASYCGVFGFKPSFGLVPRTGVLKTTDTLDTVGWFARSIADIELVFETLRVRGANYPFVERNVIRHPFSPMTRLGFYKGPHWAAATPDAREAIQKVLERLAVRGFDVESIDIPDAEDIYNEHEVIYCKALSYYFKGERRNDRSLISGVLDDMLERGSHITPEAYHQAVWKQAEQTQHMEDTLDVNAIVCLSAAGEAPLGLRTPDLADTCKIWTYLGMPSLSIPVMTGANGLPIGLQIVGRKYSDYAVLDIASRIWDVIDACCKVADPDVSGVFSDACAT